MLQWLNNPPDHLSEDDQEVFITSTYMSAGAFLVHLLYLVFFIVYDFKVLALFNIFSICIFAACFLWVRFGKNPSVIFTIGTLEIYIHAYLAASTFGLDAGFHLFLYGASLTWFLQNISLYKKILIGFFSAALSLLIIESVPATVELTNISPEIRMFVNLFNNVYFMLMLMSMTLSYNLSVNKARRQINTEFERSERLLHNILPPPIARRLKDKEKDEEENIADGFPACSVLFADIVGFTLISQQLSPSRLVAMLNEIFSMFDQLAEKHDLEKIKTIGDAYMVASGLPIPDGNHAQRLADFALDMRQSMLEYSQARGMQISIRIGIHSGPAVAGVIGKKKFIYDVWGDTVNTASRMESHGLVGEIHISNLTKELLGNQYCFEDLGEQNIKGKGMMRTWLLKDTA